MPSETLSTYLRQFSKLRTDRSANWSAATQHQAPHKPFLLLAVLDLFAQGKITSYLIQIEAEQPFFSGQRSDEQTDCSLLVVDGCFLTLEGRSPGTGGAGFVAGCGGVGVALGECVSGG